MLPLKQNICLILLIFIFTFCKKEKEAPATAQTSSTPPPPCSASGFSVNSITTVNGQSRLFKLTISSYSTVSSVTSSVQTTHQLTITTLGDTVISGIYPGKRYKIIGSQGWNFLAYSYYRSNDSIWRMIPNDNSKSDLFDIAFKLPLNGAASYTTNSVLPNSVFTVQSPSCITIASSNQPIYPIGNVLSTSIPYLSSRSIFVNGSGVMQLLYMGISVNTQNPDTYQDQWMLQRLN